MLISAGGLRSFFSTVKCWICSCEVRNLSRRRKILFQHCKICGYTLKLALLKLCHNFRCLPFTFERCPFSITITRDDRIGKWIHRLSLVTSLFQIDSSQELWLYHMPSHAHGWRYALAETYLCWKAPKGEPSALFSKSIICRLVLVRGGVGNL